MSNKKTYSSAEAADILRVSDRTVRRYLETYFKKDRGNYIISSKMLDILASDSLGTAADIDVRGFSDEHDYDVVEGFSSDEYAEFQKRLIEYPRLKEDLEYHRRSIESHQRQMEMMLKALSERNHLEAESRGLIGKSSRENKTN